MCVCVCVCVRVCARACALKSISHSFATSAKFTRIRVLSMISSILYYNLQDYTINMGQCQMMELSLSLSLSLSIYLSLFLSISSFCLIWCNKLKF